MMAANLVELMGGNLRAMGRFFEKSTSVFGEEDSDFRPEAGAYSVAEQVAHVAVTMDWFVEGTFGSGWRRDFEAMDGEVRAVSSLGAARALFAGALERVVKAYGEAGLERLESVFPADDPILPGQPRFNSVASMMDHTAHHRGSLVVYARILGKPAPMPYM